MSTDAAEGFVRPLQRGQKNEQRGHEKQPVDVQDGAAAAACCASTERKMSRMCACASVNCFSRY